MISKIEEDNLIVNERNLTANRLRSKDIFIDDSRAVGLALVLNYLMLF